MIRIIKIFIIFSIGWFSHLGIDEYLEYKYYALMNEALNKGIPRIYNNRRPIDEYIDKYYPHNLDLLAWTPEIWKCFFPIGTCKYAFLDKDYLIPLEERPKWDGKI